MIAARVLDPRSKLATARGLSPATIDSTLADQLDLEAADVDELYAALDWLAPRQSKIEEQLAARHLTNGTLVLYDVTSTYFEGRTCPLARLGHNRDGKKGKLQINIGLLCDGEGRPIAVEVFEGNVGDPKTLAVQVEKIRSRFRLDRVVLVGDRGTITEARIREDLVPIDGLAWITALRAPAIRALVEQGALQLSLFDEMDLAEISSADYAGERLVVCRNPDLARERDRKRKDLLRATERELDKVVEATRRTKRPLRGVQKISMRVGRVVGRYKVGKHFDLDIDARSLRYERNADRIQAEAALDGVYVIRTSVPKDAMTAERAVGAYKQLSRVERAFRSMKTMDLKIRPIHHRLEDRVRTHVFLCMLAYYVEWHMRRDLAPLLFDDEHAEAARAARESPVSPAVRSDSAAEKALTKVNSAGDPVQSFQSLLSNLATISKLWVQPNLPGAPSFTKITTPTPLQQKAFDLLRVSLAS
jgi:transposase